MNFNAFHSSVEFYVTKYRILRAGSTQWAWDEELHLLIHCRVNPGAFSVRSNSAKWRNPEGN